MSSSTHHPAKWPLMAMRLRSVSPLSVNGRNMLGKFIAPHSPPPSPDTLAALAGEGEYSPNGLPPQEQSAPSLNLLLSQRGTSVRERGTGDEVLSPLRPEFFD